MISIKRAAGCAAVLLTWLSIGNAGAVTLDEAKAQCHDKFVPVVQECVRKKVKESGGSPAQYLPACRDSVMAEARDCVGNALVASGTADPEIDLAPVSGRGRVVIMISGIDGTSPYRKYAEDIAKLGYYAVLIDGRQILSDDKQGGDRLATTISAAQGSANAKPGKVAVIGFSIGGGGALAYAERQPDTVAMVIAYYPATSFINQATDMKSFVGKFQVPLLAFAGGKDVFRNCCLLTTIQAMQEAAKDLGKSMDLVVYPNADHNFINGVTYRADDAEDAWKRTKAALIQCLGNATTQ